MEEIELLSPAGDMEKLKTAYYFGADACYFAGKQFGLRAFSNNFSNDELKESVEFAHSLNKKCYITLNILAHNIDFDGLADYVKYLAEIKVDAVIVSDIGIMSIVKQVAPNLEIHVSTQANITNKYSAMEFVKMGAKRLILARELSINEIKEIRDYIPKDITIETFVHGAMCISYSGRCLLSNYLTNRDSNRGACVQACRWEYCIREKNRENYLEIQEDNRGTYILNSKDLCMIEHIKQLYDAGVRSFKIEGRMKSPYYVATVTNAYRRAIDDFYANKEFNTTLKDELEKASHRKYTTGFYFGSNDKECLESSTPIQSYEFMAKVKKDAQNGYALIEQRNRFKVGDVLQVLSPDENFNKEIVVTELLNTEGAQVLDANRVQQPLYLKTDLNLKENDILRKKFNFFGDNMILHCMRKKEWELIKNNKFWGQEDLDKFGFIHCSTIEYFWRVAPNFKNVQDELVLVCIDEQKLEAEVRYEDCESNIGRFYPHIYGLVNNDAVVMVLPFNKDKDGNFIKNEEFINFKEI